MQIIFQDKFTGKKLYARNLFVVFRDGRNYYNRAKTPIAIYYDIWDNKNQTIKPRATAPREVMEELIASIDAFRNYLLSSYCSASSSGPVPTGWLRSAVEAYGKSAGLEVVCDVNRAFDLFLHNRNICYARVERYEVIRRMFLRYERYRALTAPVGEVYRLDIAGFSASDLEDFHRYVKDEHRIVEERPEILEAAPESQKPKERSDNTLHSIFSCTRSVFNNLVRKGIISQNPFMDFKFEDEAYGTPIYLDMQELRKVYELDLSRDPLTERQRDIFVFQCYVGARISDMMSFTSDNICNDVLTYVPHKTQESRGYAVTVPLSSVASDLVRKYAGSEDGRLMPFINQQHYNVYIKKFLRMAGIKRMVPVRNPKTKKVEYKPICDVASSHMARRTFVGNLYALVKDPELVGSMSGHAPGSRSFARYRKIGTDMQKELIDKLDF